VGSTGSGYSLGSFGYSSPLSVTSSVTETVYVMVGGYDTGAYAVRYYDPSTLPPQGSASVVMDPFQPDYTIVWAPALGAAGYRVSRSSTETGAYTPVGTILDDGRVYSPYSFTQTGVSTGTWWYKVTPYNQNGDGPDSAPIAAFVTPLVQGTLTPGNFTAQGQTVWYSFEAAAGVLYTLEWSDLRNSAYTAEVNGMPFRSDGSPAGFGSPSSQIIVVSQPDTIYVEARAFAPGTYAVKYSELADPPLVPNYWTEGEHTAPEQADFYYFNAEAGKTYYLQWDSLGGSGAYTGDVDVKAVRPSDENNANAGNPVAPSTLEISVPQDETIIVVVIAPYLGTPGTYAVNYYEPATSPPQAAPAVGIDVWFPGPVYNIQWQAVTGAAEYKVLRSATETGGYSQVGWTVYEDGSGWYDYPDSPPPGPGTYWYKVAASNPNGSTDSAPVSTPAALVPGTWTEGDLSEPGQVDWYKFTAPPGVPFVLEWDNIYSGSGLYTGEMNVSAIRGSDGYPAGISGSFFSIIISEPFVETIYVKVNAGINPGTYAVRLSSLSSIAPPLSQVTWTEGEHTAPDQVHWYGFTAQPGIPYALQLDTGSDGSGPYTGEVFVAAFLGSDMSYPLASMYPGNPGYHNPLMLSPPISTPETIYVMVVADFSSPGTYRVRYLNQLTAPPYIAPDVSIEVLFPAPGGYDILWQGVDGADEYTVLRSTTKEGGYSPVAPPVPDDSSYSYSYPDTGVSTGTYWYMVRASNTYGSVVSAPVSTPLPLSNNTWAEGNFTASMFGPPQSDWYTFTTGTAGIYRLQWDSNMDGSGEYTGDVFVMVTDSSGGYLGGGNIGYSAPLSINAGANTTVYVHVDRNGSGGTYAIKYYK
jgi:hypothetical protein